MSKIRISIKDWVPSIAKVENGYIVTMLTPNDELDIIETYVFKEWVEVVAFLSKNFKELEEQE